MRHKQSEYMHWAKTSQRARYNLATSGVGSYPLRDLPFDCAKLEINGDNSYGYRPLMEAIASHHGVDPDCVVEAAGTSFANHLAMAALIESGDHVLVEQPVYGPMLDAALYLGARVNRFVRTQESGFAVDPDAIRRALTPSTRLIVITNLHNPSSALTPDPVLREIGDLARTVGAHVLVDEVYLDAVYENTPRTSLHLGPEFVVTSSLTKVYGVSGIRCGWILAQPDLAWKMRRLNDVFGATPVHPGEVLGVAAFKHLQMLRERARKVVEQDRAALHAALGSSPEWGTTHFLKVGDGDAFAARLRSGHETSVVPGRFFEMPDYVRIGMGVDSEMFAEGILRVAHALGVPHRL